MLTIHAELALGGTGKERSEGGRSRGESFGGGTIQLAILDLGNAT